jgi:hypothetical protein
MESSPIKSIRFSKELYEQIADLAKKHERTFSHEVRYLLKIAIKTKNKEK